jgi:hypothetical protein
MIHQAPRKQLGVAGRYRREEQTADILPMLGRRFVAGGAEITDWMRLKTAIHRDQRAQLSMRASFLHEAARRIQ